MHLTIVLNPCLSGLRRLRTSSAPSLHSSGLSGGGPAERQRLLYQKSRRVEDCEVCTVCVCVMCVCVRFAGGLLVLPADGGHLQHPSGLSAERKEGLPDC